MTARRIWRLAGRDLAALALAIPAALVCTTLAHRHDPTRRPWPVERIQISNPPGGGAFSAESGGQALLFNFRDGVVRRGYEAGVEYRVAGLHAGRALDLALDVADRYPHEWPGQEEVQVLVDESIVWRRDVGVGTYTGWIPVRENVRPASGEMTIRVRVAVIGDPPPEAAWGGAGPFGTRAVRLVDAATGEEIDVSGGFVVRRQLRVFWIASSFLVSAGLFFFLLRFATPHAERLGRLCSRALDAIGLAESRPCTIALGLFVAALVVRVGFLAVNLRLTTFYVLQGLPFSDALMWDSMAMELARGHGFVGWVSSHRPGYSLLLSFLYTWTGHDVLLGRLLNIVGSSATAPLVFLLGRRCVAGSAGLAASLVFIFDPAILTDTQCLMTETMGLFFFVASSWCLIEGIARRRPSIVLCSGALFAVCNLTRPLTLLALPFLAGGIFWLVRRNGKGLARPLFLAALFFAAAAGLFAPWLVRQRVEYGVWALNYNAAETFYAATSPRYRSWTGLEEAEATGAGASTTGEKYRYYTGKALENIRRDPGFYARNVAGALVDLARTYDAGRFRFASLLIAACAFAHLNRIRLLQGSPWKTVSVLATVVLLLLLPKGGAFAVACLGMASALRGPVGGLSAILSGSLLVTCLSSSLVANAGVLSRLLPMVTWLLDMFFAFGLVSAGRIVSFGIPSSEGGRSENNEPIPTPELPRGVWVSRLAYIGVIAALCFVAAGGGRVLWLTVHRHSDSKPVPLVDSRILEGVARRIAPAFPSDVVLPEEILIPSASVSEPYNPAKEQLNHGRLVIGSARMTRYRYFFGPDESWNAIALFAMRPYERTIVSTEYILGEWTGNTPYFVIPGRVPSDFEDEPVLFVGRLRVNFGERWVSRRWVELLSIVPYADGTPDWNRSVLATDPHHMELLRGLAAEARQSAPR